MKSLFVKLLALISAALLGVSYSEVSKKPFDTTSYYQAEQGRVNYKEIYDYLKSPTQTTSTTESNFSLRNATKYTLQNTSSLYWLFSQEGEFSKDTSFDSLIESGNTDSVSGFSIFTVPDKTEILSPTGMNFCSTGREDEYGGNSLGLYIRLSCRDDKNKTTYEITFGSLSRLWCDMDKATPDAFKDSDEKKPQYFPSAQIPTTTQFAGGNVIGEAGKTGRNETSIVVKVEKTKDGESKEVITLSDFYSSYGAVPES